MAKIGPNGLVTNKDLADDPDFVDDALPDDGIEPDKNPNRDAPTETPRGAKADTKRSTPRK